MPWSKEYPVFTTVTCLEWKPLLADDCHKDIIVDSLKFLTEKERATIYAFVIMKNHFHLIWQPTLNHAKADVQRDFLKYTAQMILKRFRNNESSYTECLVVDAKDRKRQVWERNALSIELWSRATFMQKLNYIHNNPVKARLCKMPEEYKYSSARFYQTNDRQWDFLTHCVG
jgi:putative transposase